MVERLKSGLHFDRLSTLYGHHVDWLVVGQLIHVGGGSRSGRTLEIETAFRLVVDIMSTPCRLLAVDQLVHLAGGSRSGQTPEIENAFRLVVDIMSTRSRLERHNVRVAVVVASKPASKPFASHRVPLSVVTLSTIFR